MPSFDIVSEVDKHELKNAVDQANREISTRFDFKGTDSRIEQNDYLLTMIAPSDFQVSQVKDILRNKIAKRGIDANAMEDGKKLESLNEVKKDVLIKTGLEQDMAKKLVKAIKDSKLKVQANIQGEQLRVSGKKRDDLQSVMALLKEKFSAIPLQFNNFRD